MFVCVCVCVCVRARAHVCCSFFFHRLFFNWSIRFPK